MLRAELVVAVLKRFEEIHNHAGHSAVSWDYVVWQLEHRHRLSRLQAEHAIHNALSTGLVRQPMPGVLRLSPRARREEELRA